MDEIRVVVETVTVGKTALSPSVLFGRLPGTAGARVVAKLDRSLAQAIFNKAAEAYPAKQIVVGVPRDSAQTLSPLK